MKKYFSFLLIPVLLSCNDQNKTSSDSIDTESKNSISENTTAPGKGSCGNLVLFQEGAVIESISYDASGKEIGRGTSLVKNVTNENGVAVADVEMSGTSNTSGTSTLTAKYKCDGKSLYYDLGGLMSNLSAGGNNKIEATSIEFPINLSVGQKLPETSFTITMAMGEGVMKMKSTIGDRKVETKEEVTTPAGSWNCYKVSSRIEASMSTGGSEMDKKIAEAMKKSTGDKKMIMWFAPDFGIVKMEMYNGSQLSFRSEVTDVKK